MAKRSGLTRQSTWTKQQYIFRENRSNANVTHLAIPKEQRRVSDAGLVVAAYVNLDVVFEVVQFEYGNFGMDELDVRIDEVSAPTPDHFPHVGKGGRVTCVRVGVKQAQIQIAAVESEPAQSRSVSV